MATIYSVMPHVGRRTKNKFGLVALLVFICRSYHSEGLQHEPIETEHCFDSAGARTCYQTPGPHKSGTLTDAEAWCSQWGSSLPSVVSADEQKEIENFLQMANFTSAQTVLTSAQRLRSKYWKWVDGVEVGVDYEKTVSFVDVIANKPISNDSWVADISVNQNYTSFLTARPVHTKSYYICDYPDTKFCDTRSPPAQLYYEINCFSLHTDSKETFWDARNLCLSYGGDLSVAFDQNFKYRIEPKKLTVNATYWVGITHQCWQWQPKYGDVVEMKYSNWDEPTAPQDSSQVSCVCLDGKNGVKRKRRAATSPPYLGSSPAQDIQLGGEWKPNPYPSITEQPPAYPETPSPNSANKPWPWIECDCTTQWHIICQRKENSSSTEPGGSLPTGVTETTTTAKDGSNSTAVGLGVGLGIGLFALLILAAAGLYFFIKKRKSESTYNSADSTKYFTTLGRSAPPIHNGDTKNFNNTSISSINSRHLPELPYDLPIESSGGSAAEVGSAERYQDLRSSWTRKEGDPVPHKYERLQETKPPTPPPFIPADGYYEQIPEEQENTNLGEYSNSSENSSNPKTPTENSSKENSSVMGNSVQASVASDNSSIVKYPTENSTKNPNVNENSNVAENFTNENNGVNKENLTPRGVGNANSGVYLHTDGYSSFDEIRKPGSDYIPGSEYTAPSEGYIAPSEGYSAPSEGYIAPSEGYSAPSESLDTRQYLMVLPDVPYEEV